MNYKTCWNLTQGYDECDEIKHLRAALAAKDAEIERLKDALAVIERGLNDPALDDAPPVVSEADRYREWVRRDQDIAADANTAPEQKPEPERKICEWESRGFDGWRPGCCNEEDGGCSKWEYPLAPTKCPDCGKRVEVKP